VTWFSRRDPVEERRRTLRSRPIRRTDVTLVGTDDGGAKLRVPLRRRAGPLGLFKMPEGAAKTFELDAIGRYVWDQLDGKTRTEEVVRRVARRHDLAQREAEVATLSFLNLLGKRGLVGVRAEDMGGGEGARRSRRKS